MAKKDPPPPPTPLPTKCPPHIWAPIFDDDGKIIGRICTKGCGAEE